MKICLRRRTFRARYRSSPALLPLLLAFALSLGLFRYLSVRLKPLIETIAVSKAVNLISLAISEETFKGVADEELTYKDFVDVEIGASDQITSLSFNTVEGVRFKQSVVRQLVERLERIEPADLEIPLGTLSGAQLLSALGPSIRVRVQSVGDVSADFRNEFTSAGVNQTLHSVFLDVTASIYLIIPGNVIPVSATEHICVAETVIVGAVPDTYLNLQNGAD